MPDEQVEIQTTLICDYSRDHGATGMNRVRRISKDRLNWKRALNVEGCSGKMNENKIA